MDLENFKRWHWIVVGILVGILWAGVRLFYGYSLETEVREDGESQFEIALLATEKHPARSTNGDDGNLYLSDIKIYPAIKDDGPDVRRHTQPPPPAPRPTFTIRFPWSKSPTTAKSAAPKPHVPPPTTAPAETRDALATASTESGPKRAAPDRMINWVTGVVHSRQITFNPKTRQRTLAPTTRAIPFRYKATIPFTPDPRFDYVAFPHFQLRQLPGYSSPGFKEYPNVQAYLDELNRKYGSGSVAYHYAWWESRRVIPILYPLAGLIVIGGIWPTALSLMIGAGFGRKKTAGSEYDLSRFKGSSKAKMPKLSTALTAEDHRRLAELEAAMEERLQPDILHAAQATVATAEPKSSVRALTATQLADKVALEDPKPHKSFGASGGDYYPTEIHIDKQKK